MKRHHAFVGLLLVGCLFILPRVACAQSEMPVNASRFQRQGVTVGLGLAPTCFDSYLSPNGYTGLSANVGLEQWRALPWCDGHLYAQTFSQTTLGLAVAGGASSELLAMEDLSYALPWQWYANDWLRLYAGAEVQGRLGGIWNTRNSNNPANLKAGIHLGGMAMAEFRYRLGRFPVRSSVSFDMPLLGAFFSPEYTQSYYELFYVGGVSPYVHFATPVNCLSGRGRMVTDFTLHHSILRLSFVEDNYRWQTRTNQYALHTFSLGIGFVFNAYRIHPHETAASFLPY